MKFVIMEDVIEDVSGPVNKILRIFHTKVREECFAHKFPYLPAFWVQCPSKSATVVCYVRG